MAVSRLKSNICNANLNKNKKKLFLYSDIRHTNKKNATKKMRFFSYTANTTKNLKLIDEKCCLKCK